MRYTVQGSKARQFELTDDSGRNIGQMYFPKWYSTRAEIILASGDNLLITPERNLLQTIHVTNEGVAVATVKFGWMGKISITLADGSEYMFKRVSLFSGTFGLFNANGHKVVNIKQEFYWKRFAFNYEINTDDNYPEGKDIGLLLIAIYVITAMQRRGAAVA